MAPTKTVPELLDDVFEELVLAVALLDAAFDPEDELVERFVRTLDTVRDKALLRLEDLPAAPGPEAARNRLHGEPHPAIEAFLEKLGRA